MWFLAATFSDFSRRTSHPPFEQKQKYNLPLTLPLYTHLPPSPPPKKKKQAQFNSVLLALEQEAYEGEGVDFSRVEWRSNEETLAALDARPGGIAGAGAPSSAQFSVGLLALLDEACIVPGGTDAGFGLRVSEVLAGGGSSSSSSAASTPSSARALEASAAASAAAFASSSAVISGCPAGAGSSFSVAHAAGKVSYSTAGFLSKNRDVVSAEALALLSKFSTEPLLKEISAAAAAAPAGSGPRSAGNSSSSSSSSNNNATVVSAFRLQLRSLLSRLDASQLHFVRCIKPNARAAANSFDGALVAHQLRCAGVAEVARVARQGFPTRAPYSEIANRFSALVFPPLPRKGGGGEEGDAEGADHRATVSALLSSPFLRDRLGDGDGYALGRSKVFMRAGALAALEAELRVRSAAVTAVSSRFRGRRQRVLFLEARRSAVAIQAAVRGRAARKQLLEEERAREEKRRAAAAAEEEERAEAAAAAGAAANAAAASLAVERSSSSAASVLRGAEKLVEAADAEAAAAAKRAASGGKWLHLPKVPLSLRRGSRSSEGGVAPATPRPPPASSSGAAEVALWEAYAERLEAQVASLLRTNRALQGSLAAARADARAAATAAAAAGTGGGNGKKGKSCFSSCSSSSAAVASSSSSSSSTLSAAAEHAASLRALDALRESLEKREALFEDDAAFLEEVATGAVAAAPGFQLFEETRRLRKRFSSFVGSFSGRMEATEVVVLGAAEAKRAREQAAAAAAVAGGKRGGGGVESKRDFFIPAASPLQEGGGGKIATERRGTAVVSLEARAA